MNRILYINACVRENSRTKELARHLLGTLDGQIQTVDLSDENIKPFDARLLAKRDELLKENKKLLDNMARLLVERETIFSEEVEMLMEGKSVEEIMLFMDENERTLSQNPFERRAAKSVIVKEKEEKIEESLSTEAEEKTENSAGGQAEEKEDKE